jgi:hypothetical protein
VDASFYILVCAFGSIRTADFIMDDQPNMKAAGESGIRGLHVPLAERFSELVEVLGRLGWSIIARPSWTGNEPISRHPSRVPILDGLATHGAFEAADLALLCHMLTAVIHCATITGSITRRL